MGWAPTATSSTYTKGAYEPEYERAPSRKYCTDLRSGFVIWVCGMPWFEYD
jgi:hypothetical protein